MIVLLYLLLACPPGKYQDDTGQDSCLDCTPGSVTDGLGSVASTACVACQPGQYSASPMVACVSCIAGSVTNTQAGSGATDCTQCAPGKFSPDPTTSCGNCDSGTFQAYWGEATCEECGAGYAQPLTGQTECQDENECETSPCFNDALCVNEAGGFLCACTLGWGGQYCSEEVEICPEPNSCESNTTRGTCEVNTVFSAGYVCSCLSGFETASGAAPGTECIVEQNPFAGTELSVSPTTLMASIFTFSSKQRHLELASIGTTDLIITAINTTVPWASVFDTVPGVTPTYGSNHPISPGQSRSIGVFFQGASAGGTGSFNGILSIYYAPAGAVQIPLQVQVSPPVLAVVGQPTDTVMSLTPTSVHNYTLLTITNTLAHATDWFFDAQSSCVCGLGTVLSCAFESAPWIEVDVCNGTELEINSQTTVKVALVAPTSIGTYYHPFSVDVWLAESNIVVPWPLTCTLEVETNAALFSSEYSSFEYSWVSDDGELHPDTEMLVVLNARDMFNNTIEGPIPQDIELIVVADSGGSNGSSIGRRRGQDTEATNASTVLSTFFQFDYETYTMQKTTFMPSNGSFELEAVFNGSSIAPEDGISAISVLQIYCNPETHHASSNGSVCLIAQCPCGQRANAQQTNCTDCEPGQYSSSNTAGHPHAASCFDCESGSFCGQSGCTECSECAVGRASEAGETSCIACDAGKFAPGVRGHEICDDCAAGKYCNQPVSMPQISYM